MKWAHIIAEDNCADLGIIDDIANFPIVAHVHDEGQMEVDSDQVETYTYPIPKDTWKEEEKVAFKDDKGRMWSAPKLIEEDVKTLTLTIQRYYHPIGEQYCKALEAAGKLLGLRCPTAGEYMVGDSWADTH